MGKSEAGRLTDWRAADLTLLELLSLGLGNKQIAAQVGVSETAIKKRLAALMRRLEVGNRVALVRVALLSGVLAAHTRDGTEN